MNTKHKKHRAKRHTSSAATTRPEEGTTVGDVIARLLPRGSNMHTDGSLKRCPDWPPDLFAVAATLVETSGCYAEPCYTAPWNHGDYHYTDDYRRFVVRLGTQWAKT